MNLGEKRRAMHNLAKAIHAPEFPKGMEWFNARARLHLRDFKGKIVLLFFWNSSCAECLRIVPDLERLHAKYEKELNIIGVHSPRLELEKSALNVQKAISFHQIEFPVVNDTGMLLWRAYDVRACPTIYILDPKGVIMGYMCGEGVYSPMDELVSELVSECDAKGLIDRNPLKFLFDAIPEPETTFSPS